jgi:Ser/Thr protein kinase RdoA (MazF antagonist)
MSSETAAAVAAAYRLGTPVAAPRYADRGELGYIWRLDTDRGAWAVKESDLVVTEADAADDVAFQEAAAARVRRPAPIRTGAGRVVLPGSAAGSAAATLRVYEWVDLLPDERVTPAEIGAALARLHRVEHPAGGPVPDWFAAPVGTQGWHDLLAAAVRAGAVWAPALDRRLPDLIALDAAVEPPDPDRLRTCHYDVNLDNVRRARDGEVVVLDWENSGPGQPERELAGVLADLAADLPDPAALPDLPDPADLPDLSDLSDPADLSWSGGPAGADGLTRTALAGVVAAHDAYRRAGGPARLTGPRDFSTAIAVRGHLFGFYGRRSINPAEPADNRQRADRRLRLLLDQPLTLSRVAALLAASADPGL